MLLKSRTRVFVNSNNIVLYLEDPPGHSLRNKGPKSFERGVIIGAVEKARIVYEDDVGIMRVFENCAEFMNDRCIDIPTSRNSRAIVAIEPKKTWNLNLV